MKVRILIGLPGSGKSTWTEEHCKDWKIHSADHYFMIGKEYKFNASELGKAHDACLFAFTRSMMEVYQAAAYIDKNLVVDNTNLSWIEMAPYVSMALAFGYEVELILFDADKYVCVQRNVHNVPEKTIMLMADKLSKMQDAGMPRHWEDRVTKVLVT